MNNYKDFIKSKQQIFKNENAICDADFSRAFDTDRLAMHWIELPPQQKTSNPHAESIEEEFIYVVSGNPHVWVNGYIYELHPGICVGFPAGTGIAHTFINNSSEIVEMVVLGERTKKENKCSFPINPELKEQQKDIWWEDYPKQEFGPHDGNIGNLNYQKSWQQLSFIKSVFDAERKASFSYPGDTEKFTAGKRLTDLVGLKTLGVWHEIMNPEKRSSWPHAHKFEEEAAIILKGNPKVWLNGFVYDLKPGDCVFFKPESGIAHTLINPGDEPVEFLGIGEANDGGVSEKIAYPLHQTRNEQCENAGFLWTDCPSDLLFEDDFGVPPVKDFEIKIVSDVESFLELAKNFLLQRETEYSLQLGLCELRKSFPKNSDDYFYIAIFRDKNLIGTAVLTERALTISALEEPVILQLCLFLKKENINFSGVVGPAMTSEAIARISGHITNQKVQLVMGQKIYELTQVLIPQNIAGKLSLANELHQELVGQWLYEFNVESLPHEKTTLDKTIALAKIKISKNEVYLWLDKENNPVSMNMISRPTQNGISISGVYTPKNLRKRGYASAVVSGTSQKMLESGKKFCVLYTDTANPTSNKIYQQIGFREIATSKYYMFSAG